MSARKNNEIFDPTAPAPRASTPQSTRLSRLMREAGWIVFLALAIYLVLIFATYQQSDPGYFFTVKDGPILNKGGWTGAQISHLAFGISGISAWWWVALAVYAVMRLFHRVEEGHRRPPKVRESEDDFFASRSKPFVCLLPSHARRWL